MNDRITPPEAFFGEMPGSDGLLINWDKLCEYYKLLETQSERLKVEIPGKTTEGNDFLMLYVSSAENLKRLDEYAEISRCLANNEHLTDEEIAELSEKGKAIVYQDYSIHSNETGPAQSVPLILYELLCADEESELSRVLEDVIFILCPCGEPDGLIKFHDFYYKYKGTCFEGFCAPNIRHSRAGHCNNRDATFERLCESRYMNDVVIRKFHPQIVQEFHHQYPYDPRMTIAPTTNPMFDKYSGLMEFETTMCGSAMAAELAAAGRKGIVCGDEAFSSFPINTFHHHARLHNIIGMLSENADVRIASPIYIHPQRQSRYRYPTSSCPIPWEGGEWHLSDIVTNIRIASVAILRHAMKNKTMLLRNMALKAKMQSERGENDPRHTIMIPCVQNDASSLNEFLRILQNMRVRVYRTNKELLLDGVTYPVGTYAVPLSQPKYAAVCIYADKASHPMNEYTVKPDGTPKITDSANISVCLAMGIKTYPANQKVSLCDLEPCDSIPEYIPQNFPWSAKENISYLLANKALSKGTVLYRDEKGDFHDTDGEGKYRVRLRKVGIYLRGDSAGSLEIGFTRHLLETYGFDVVMITDTEIRENGVPSDIEVLIFAGDTLPQIAGGDEIPEKAPIEYRTGIGKGGVSKLQAFFDRGGRVVAWEKSCDYFNQYFKLGLCDKCKNLSLKEYGTFGSLLRAKAENIQNDIMLGMPKRFLANSIYGTVLYPLDIVHRFDVLASFEEENVLECGYIRGEQLISGTPCIMRCSLGKGDLLLYTFSPHFRFQQNGTFKVLFNALYKNLDEKPAENKIFYRAHYELADS